MTAEPEAPKPRRGMLVFYVVLAIAALLLIGGVLGYRPLKLRYHSWQYGRHHRYEDLEAAVELLGQQNAGIEATTSMLGKPRDTYRIDDSSVAIYFVGVDKERRNSSVTLFFRSGRTFEPDMLTSRKAAAAMDWRQIRVEKATKEEVPK